MDINSTQLFLVKHAIRRICRLIFKNALLLMFLAGTPISGTSTFAEIQNPEYVTFWSDYKNIFLFQPGLIRTVFLGIIDLKGNAKTARRIINYEALGCRTEVSFTAGCRMDQLKLQKRKRKISDYYTIPVNFTDISVRRYKKNKLKSVVSINWRPALFQPPLISVDTFLNFINAARNSKLYELKPGIERILLIPDFQKNFEIVVDTVMADNLNRLYENLHPDFQDSITFKLDSTQSDIQDDIGSFNLDLKAVKVKINNQTYSVETDEIL